MPAWLTDRREAGIARSASSIDFVVLVRFVDQFVSPDIMLRRRSKMSTLVTTVLSVLICLVAELTTGNSLFLMSEADLQRQF